jgi:hypothetical protein
MQRILRVHLLLSTLLAGACGSDPVAAPSELETSEPETSGDESATADPAECPLFCRPHEGSCKRPDFAEPPHVSCGAYSMDRLPDAPLVDCPASCCTRAGDPASGDADADGILDDVDQCDDEPEQPDGYRDWDGCSADEQDNDGDAIEDVDDRCCYTAEDSDGVEDEDGCPDR